MTTPHTDRTILKYVTNVTNLTSLSCLQLQDATEPAGLKVTWVSQGSGDMNLRMWKEIMNGIKHFDCVLNGKLLITENLPRLNLEAMQGRGKTCRRLAYERVRMKKSCSLTHFSLYLFCVKERSLGNLRLKIQWWKSMLVNDLLCGVNSFLSNLLKLTQFAFHLLMTCNAWVFKA